ncbi:MAG: biotin/lipoate A/B protein ligase family protein [Spirochaetes bacterium]|nr:biotin/lipoate A/B protein ligase family protein [Spirochaetota bacterium]
MKFESFLLEGLSPIDHLAAEACLLSETPSDRFLLLFYVDFPSVIIGKNQNPWKEIAPSSPLPFFRRTSGGGAVYHDAGNLNWAFIVPRNAHDKDAELALMADAVSSLGRKVIPGPRGGLFLAEGDTGQGAKVSGTARRFDSRKVLHHGTLLVSADLSALVSSLGGLETRDDLSLRSIPAKTANLSGGSLAFSPLEAAAAIARFISGCPPVPLSFGSIDPEAFERERGLFGSDEWRCGTTPPFALDLGDAGASGAKVIVEKGRVARFEGGTVRPQESLTRFLGSPFSFSLATELSKSFIKEKQRCRNELSMS